MLASVLTLLSIASGDPGESLKAHWAFSAPTRPEVPATTLRGWVRNPIDAFILRDSRRSASPRPPRPSRIALIRRLRFDLTGLPPTPAEVDAFVADDRPDAYERLVDRLLGLAPVRRAAGPALARPGPVSPRATGSRATRPGRTPGGIATGSSRPSTPTCPTTGSSPSSSPATRSRRATPTRSSPPGSTGTGRSRTTTWSPA